MLRQKKIKNRHAQSMLEYTIILSVTIGILIAMGTLIRRGVQGMLRVAADQVGVQQNGEQFVSFNDESSAYVVHTYTASRADTSKETREIIGNVQYIFGDTVSSSTDTLLNMGFTKDPNFN